MDFLTPGPTTYLYGGMIIPTMGCSQLGGLARAPLMFCLHTTLFSLCITLNYCSALYDFFFLFLSTLVSSFNLIFIGDH